MSDRPRLSAACPATPNADWPTYAPEDHGIGIVHLGLGNFARAHLLAYTDVAMAEADGDWRVVGVSLRGTEVADRLNPQDGRYTLINRGETISAQVIGALAGVLAGSDVSRLSLDAMSAPSCRIVSLTVTEKGYGLTSAGALDLGHPAVAADLASPHQPRGVIGLITKALAARRDAGILPFTVLSCDNLSHNGQKLRAGVLDFARRSYSADLATWIAEKGTFPSTMVDRITPASTDATRQAALDCIGYADLAAVETEPFRQWVIENHFCAGRPAWERAGAIFVADVAPYEAMKLRMLNGAHSMLAYSGQLSGKEFVRDVMADPAHAALVRLHLRAAAQTVTGIDIDLEAYAAALEARFRNPAIAHATAQIAMDGTQKLPQRITAPALEAMAAGQDTRPFALALAAWLAWIARRDAKGLVIAVSDPKSEGLARAAEQDNPSDLITAVAALCPEILPTALLQGPIRTELQRIFEDIRAQGMEVVIRREARSVGSTEHVAL